jgi:putative endonuclease
MAEHNQTGKTGEELVVDHMLKNGFRILHRNWRYRHYEIDILGERKGVLHVIEVKCTKSKKNTNPEDAVTLRKFRFLTEACQAFLTLNPKWDRVQYDIAAVTLFPQIEIFVLEDVYLF